MKRTVILAFTTLALFSLVALPFPMRRGTGGQGLSAMAYAVVKGGKVTGF